MQDFFEDGPRIPARPCAGASHHEAVFEHRAYESLDVIRNDEAAALDHCQGLGCSEERNRTARTDAQFYFRMFMSLVHELSDLVNKRALNKDL